MPDERPIAKQDRVQGVYEGGPRLLSLLRRLVAGLEEQLGHEIRDPGPASELPNSAVTWADNAE